MQKFKIFTINLLLVIFVAGIIPRPAYATAPTFPSCVNPQGVLKSSYDSGVHGVVGRVDTYKGSDKVFQLQGNDQIMQCLCPESGSGIQSNWWKASSLTEDQIKIYQNEGWIYVADGSAWGLDSRPYLAKNSEYNCRPTSETTTTSTSSSSTSTSSTNTGSTTPLQSVLNLASTGNMPFIYGLIIIGTAFLITGWILRPKKN